MKEKGQDLIAYALALVVLAGAAASAAAFAVKINQIFTQIGQMLSSYTS